MIQSRFYWLYWLMPGSSGAGSGAQEGPIGARGGVSLFDHKESLWLSFDLMNNGLVGALEAWFLRTGQPLTRTEVIFPNELVDPLNIKILEL